MKYSKADKVLPIEIVEIIQQYIDGEYLYIPRKVGKEKSWGEKSGTRNMLDMRNKDIYSKYLKGASVMQLASEFYLSDKSIRRIICEQKKKCSNST